MQGPVEAPRTQEIVFISDPPFNSKTERRKVGSYDSLMHGGTCVYRCRERVLPRLCFLRHHRPLQDIHETTPETTHEGRKDEIPDLWIFSRGQVLRGHRETALRKENEPLVLRDFWAMRNRVGIGFFIHAYIAFLTLCVFHCHFSQI